MRIAVICASHRRNSGMYSVDLAAADFLARHGFDFELFCAQHKLRKASFDFGRLHFRVLRDLSMLEGFTHVLYWGDFINNLTYGLRDFTKRELAFGYAETPAEAFANWMRLFLLLGDGPRRWRVLSISNNFQNLSHELTGPLAARIGDLYARNFDAIFPRDEFSLRNLKTHYPDAAQGLVRPGIDAAFLLRAQALLPARRGWNGRGSFAYFLGRSKLRNTEALIRRISRETKLRPVRLRHWLALTPRSADRQFLRSLKIMRDSRFVLSDAYHCCVNAMNLGRPVLGIGRPEVEQKGTLGDFKKAELFRMHGIEDLYSTVTAGEMSESDMRAVAQKARAVMNDADFAERRYAILQAQRTDYETLLLETLRASSAFGKS